jgi:hypothetical protein
VTERGHARMGVDGELPETARCCARVAPMGGPHRERSEVRVLGRPHVIPRTQPRSDSEHGVGCEASLEP